MVDDPRDSDDPRDADKQSPESLDPAAAREERQPVSDASAHDANAARRQAEYDEATELSEEELSEGERSGEEHAEGGHFAGEHAEGEERGEVAADDEPAPPEDVRVYHRAKLSGRLGEMVLDVGSLFAFAFFGSSIDRWLLQSADLHSPALRLAVFFVLMALTQALLQLPLSLYSDHLLEDRYGLNRQSLGRWFRRYWLKVALALLLGLVLTGALFAIIWSLGPWWWLVAGAAFFLFTVLMGQLAPVILLPLLYKVERLEDESLTERFRTLAEGTGLRIEGVYRLKMSDETAKANAMLAGLGGTRRVILGDTLLDNFSAEEIDIVLAHEIGHHHYRHIPQFLVLGGLMSLGSFWICDLVIQSWMSATGAAPNYASLPVAFLPWLLLTITGLSLLTTPIRNAISRHFERQCDRYAIRKTEDRESFRSTFRKLALLNKADTEPPRWEVVLLHDHPPIEERIALADEPPR